MRKIVKIILGLLIIVILSSIAVLYFNPNLNYFKLKSVEKNALDYIDNTYPDFKVNELSVSHEWKSNHYVVTYKDDSDNERILTYDFTGENIFSDNYIIDEAHMIVHAYTNSIKEKIKMLVEANLNYKTHYIIVDDTNAYGKDREIVLNKLDISNDPVECTIGLVAPDEVTKAEFAQVALEIYEIIYNGGLPIAELNIVQQNSPESRFDIKCPGNMDKLSVSDIEKLIQ